jgi:hypothetical protein
MDNQNGWHADNVLIHTKCWLPGIEAANGISYDWNNLQIIVPED